MTEFAKWLYEQRKAKGMTQIDLAQALRTSQSTIFKYESGRAKPRQATLHRIAELFGPPPDDAHQGIIESVMDKADKGIDVDFFNGQTAIEVVSLKSPMSLQMVSRPMLNLLLLEKTLNQSLGKHLLLFHVPNANWPNKGSEVPKHAIMRVYHHCDLLDITVHEAFAEEQANHIVENLLVKQDITEKIHMTMKKFM